VSEDTATDAATPATPFTMVPGDPFAMVCDGDVCFIPGTAGDTE